MIGREAARFSWRARLPSSRRNYAHLMTDFLEVSTTADSRETAAALARSAVQARLAASARVIGPVASFFWHEGTFGEGEEYIAALKTTADKYAALEAHLLAEHPWKNPEISAAPLVAGSIPYLEWLQRTIEP